MNTDINQAEARDTHEDQIDALYFITHELKNTVIGIVGLLRLLIRSEEDPDRKEKLKIILDQASISRQ